MCLGVAALEADLSPGDFIPKVLDFPICVDFLATAGVFYLKRALVVSAGLELTFLAAESFLPPTTFACLFD